MPQTQAATKTKTKDQKEKQYAALIRAGKVAMQNIRQSQWLLGDLALRACPSLGGKADNGRLRKYAEDIGCEYGALKNYRTTSQAWPEATRTFTCSYSVYRILAARSNRAELIHDSMTADEAEAIASRDATTGIKGGGEGSYRKAKKPEDETERINRLKAQLDEEDKQERLALEATPQGKSARKAQGLLRKAVSTVPQHPEEAVSLLLKVGQLLEANALSVENIRVSPKEGDV